MRVMCFAPREANSTAQAAPHTVLEVTLIRDAVLLDAGMSVHAAVRRLAQHGFWLDPHQPAARSWLEEYVAKINKHLSQDPKHPAGPTLADVEKVLKRPDHRPMGGNPPPIRHHDLLVCTARELTPREARPCG